jgi:polyisoprenoid-binding protein YceI
VIVLLNLITHRTNSAAGPAYNPSLLANFDFFAHAENKRALGTETKSGMRGQIVRPIAHIQRLSGGWISRKWGCRGQFLQARADIDVLLPGRPVGQVTLDLDRPACKIDFTLGAVLHTVHGTFEVKQGMLRLDVASGKISGRIVVDVKSGNTGDDERDRSMHREVLESARFPEAVFSPDRLTGQLALAGQSEVGVHGVLRIHGQDHDVTLPAKISVENGRLTATSHLSIPYVKWGMKDPSTFLLHVNETVEVEMRVAGTIRQQ